MTAADRALFAKSMREAEAEHLAYADEGGTPPYKHARDVALACRLAAMVAEPDRTAALAAADEYGRDMCRAFSARLSFLEGWLAAFASLTGAAEEAQTP